MFDPVGAVTFDLTRGQVLLRGGTPQVLIPAELLAAACRGATPDQIGRQFGEQVATRTGQDQAADRGEPADQPYDEVIEQLAGAFSLAGMGTLRLERWGRAVVFVVAACPLGSAVEAFVEAFLTAACGQLGKRTLATVSLVPVPLAPVPLGTVPEGTGDGEARFVLLAPSVAATMRQRIEAGESWRSLLMSLQPGAPRDAG
jgi:hypothetical protein